MHRVSNYAGSDIAPHFLLLGEPVVKRVQLNALPLAKTLV